MRKNKELVGIISRHPFYLGIAAIAILLLAFAINFRKLDISSTIAEWGQFGDYLGGVLNPIFGLISVVIISATLQTQIKYSRKQEFDNQFFSLLQLYDSVLQSIDMHSLDGSIVRKGRDSFFIFYGHIKEICDERKVPLNIGYSSFLEQRGWEVEHYFRTVYHLFKHVRDAAESGLVEQEDKKKYYDLIKSQISQYELVLLWLNTQSEHKGKWDQIILDAAAEPFEHLNKSLLNNAHLISSANPKTSE